MQKPAQRHISYKNCRNYLLGALPLAALAVYLYGLRPLVMLAIAFALSFLCDLAVCGMRSTRFEISDLSSYMFAAIFTLMLPASAPYYVVIAGTLACVLLGKHAFGGYGSYPFSPTAFGFAFVSVCWPDWVYSYPQPFSEIGLGWVANAQLYEAPASALKYGGVPYVETSDLILGDFAGPMGATFCLIILAVFFFLIETRTISGHVGISYLIACAAMSFAFPRVSVSRWESVMYEMLSGCLVFAAVFIASEPSSAPKTGRAKIVFGLLMGVATMLFRYYGVFEMGSCFSILLISPLAGLLDRKLAFVHKPSRSKGASEQQ